MRSFIYLLALKILKWISIRLRIVARYCVPYSSQHRQLISASELFDADWYEERYGRNGAGQEAALDHFLRHGLVRNFDPGPAFSSRFYLETHGFEQVGFTTPLLHHLQSKNSRTKHDQVLKSAFTEAVHGDLDRSVFLAETWLPKDLQQPVAAFRASRGIRNGNEAEWQHHINKYLQSNGLAEISLQAGNSILDRLTTCTDKYVTDGPLVSVLMPVWNSEETLRTSVQSILSQTWRSVELIVVDDASTDRTPEILSKLAEQDSRLIVRRNAVNVGPYVSKNLALSLATGSYVTGQDADDWSHGERLEKHIALMRQTTNKRPISVPYGLRMERDGFFSRFVRSGQAGSVDGWRRVVSIGALIETDFLRSKLGYWDSVRFAADTELFMRASHYLGGRALQDDLVTMVCLDSNDSLSNNSMHGTQSSYGGLSLSRRRYRRQARKWLRSKPAGTPLVVDLIQNEPRFSMPDSMWVSPENVRLNKAEHQLNQEKIKDAL